jgi:4-hydroxy-2-oxoglutarate aldolase
MKLQGMFASAATPFDASGAVYRAKVQHNFDKWSRTSLAGFVIGGMAGEGSLLEPQEKLDVLRLAVPVIPAGRTIMLDVSSDGVLPAANLARAAAEAGAHVAISQAPRHRPEAQSLYFRALADQSPIPIAIQNGDLAPDAIARLAEHPNIAGVVTDAVQEVRSAVSKDFAVLAASESQVWESLKAGASGAVLAFASAAPYATIAIWEAFRTREEEAGVDWQGRIAHPSILVTDIHGPAGLKHAMDLNGYYGGPPRLPLVTCGAAAKAEIEQAFRDLKG